MNSVQRNAFEILKNAQKHFSLKSMPDLTENPRTAKQKLMNDIITFLAEKGCRWRGCDEVSSFGMNLVHALTDALWNIDGHHHVFKKIPSIFSKFIGYNRPEISKHRKRQVANMSGIVLRSLAAHLFHCLQAGYWNRSDWTEIKTDVEQLAQSLAQYSDYLERNLKKVRLNHSLASPVRELSTNLHFQFLPICDSTSSSQAIVTKLEGMPDYQHIAVEDYCPADFRVKYRFVQKIKTTGFPFHTALLSYTHGNNIGNLHFLWKVECSSDVSFSQCQPVIEIIKKDIPVYHTRTMRKEMFSVFGRLTPNLKPAAARHIYRIFTGKY